MLMKYEEIYKKIRDEIGIISCKVYKMQNENRSHRDWLDIDHIKQSIEQLRNYIWKFHMKIIEDGGSTI